MTRDQETTSQSTVSAAVEQYLLTGWYNNNRRVMISRCWRYAYLRSHCRLSPLVSPVQKSNVDYI